MLEPIITDLSCLTRQILTKFHKVRIRLRANSGAELPSVPRSYWHFCVAQFTLNGPTGCGFRSTLNAASG